MTTADLIHLGSDTKAMTAVLVGRPVQRHQLRWVDTMADVFPDVRLTMDAAMAGVTVADLLDHTAGLPHDLPWGTVGVGQSLPAQRLAAARLALSPCPTSPPGSRYAYSNVGYTLLGAVVERKAGRRWEQVIAEELFRPLGMATAGFGRPGTNTMWYCVAWVAPTRQFAVTAAANVGGADADWPAMRWSAH